MKTYLSMIALLCAMITPSTASADGIWKTYPAFTTALAYDGEYFWLGQEYKVLKWNKEKGIVAEYLPKDGLPGVWIREIYLSPDKKKVWAASDSGIARLDGTTWRNYTTRDGLADNSIGKVAFSGNDTLWVGTNKGVSRFDGKVWETFSTLNGLSSNTIMSIAVDNDGMVWAGTDAGVSAYNGTKWNKYTTTDGLSDNNVRFIVVDKNNVKWLGAKHGYYDTDRQGGISRFDGSTWSSYTPGNGIDARNVVEMTVGPDNTLWLSMFDVRYNKPTSGGNGTYLYYAYLYNNNGVKFTLLHDETSQGYGSPYFSNFTFDINKQFYFIISEQLMKYTPSNGAITGIANLNHGAFTTRKTILFDNANIPWLLEGSIQQKIDDSQAWITWLEGKKLHRQGFGPALDNTYSLAIGPNDEKWVGSAGGVGEFNKDKWEIQTFWDQNVLYTPTYTLVPDKDGGAWLGGGDFIHFTWSGVTVLTDNLPARNVRSLAIDDSNVKWIGFGSDGKGVVAYDGTTWRQYTTTDGLIDDKVNAIAVDSGNKKWFGTSAGVSRYDGISWTSFPTAENGNSFGTVNTLACDGAILWAGTNNGLIKYDGSSWARFTPKDGLADTSVISLAVGQKGVVWAGTPSGLSRYDGTSWRTFKTADGLPSDRVQALAVDHDNVVWIGTDKGLVSYQEDTGSFVQENNALPATFPAITSYPNPFNPSTTIEFTIPFARDTELSVYSITGQKVRTLVAGTLTPGKHTTRWDGRDDAGKNVSSGIYIARLKTGGQATVRKMLLMK